MCKGWRKCVWKEATEVEKRNRKQRAAARTRGRFWESDEDDREMPTGLKFGEHWQECTWLMRVIWKRNAAVSCPCWRKRSTWAVIRLWKKRKAIGWWSKVPRRQERDFPSCFLSSFPQAPPHSRSSPPCTWVTGEASCWPRPALIQRWHPWQSHSKPRSVNTSSSQVTALTPLNSLNISVPHLSIAFIYPLRLSSSMESSSEANFPQLLL